MEGTLKVFTVMHDYVGPVGNNLRFTPDTCRARRVVLFSRVTDMERAPALLKAWKELNAIERDIHAEFIPFPVPL